MLLQDADGRSTAASTSDFRVVKPEAHLLWHESTIGSAQSGLRSLHSRPDRNSRASYYAILMLIDLAGFVAAFLTIDLVRHRFITDQWLMLSLIGAPIFIATSMYHRAYCHEVLLRPADGIRKSLISLLVAFASTLGILFWLGASEEFSRIVFTAGAVLAMTLIATARFFFGHALGSRCRWKFFNEVVLIDGMDVQVGAGEVVLYADRLDLRPSLANPIALERLSHILKDYDRVILACRPDKRVTWSGMLKALDIDVEVLVPELSGFRPLGLRQACGHSSLLVGCAPLSLGHRMAKRGFDLGVALLALIFFAPPMLLVSALIKLDSAGPVFFRQARIGCGNRQFHVLKFRTMRAEAADAQGTRSASRVDDRVTRVGSILRRTSLDELPQLLNVLAGQMSIVGPRPHALASTAEDELFWNIDPEYLHRHTVKPGITGLAQVRGFRGATESRSDLTNRLQADLEYLSGWSIGRDIAIIARTFRVMIHQNAY